MWIVRNDPRKAEDVGYRLVTKGDIWDGRDVEYYQKIQKLENFPFNLANFEKTIEDSRLRITQVITNYILIPLMIINLKKHFSIYGRSW